VAALLALLTVGLASMGASYRTWAMICVIPLMFAGLALVHARAEVRGQGKGWLAVFYVAWLIFDPVKLLVLFAAIADSWMKFRQRWTPANKGVAKRDDED
jgi:hypothetical protein